MLPDGGEKEAENSDSGTSHQWVESPYPDNGDGEKALLAVQSEFLGESVGHLLFGEVPFHVRVRSE